MAIDINEIAINEAIRYHKPNDPYYWEVDNLPLIDIMRNIVLTADKINELVLEVNNHYDKGEIDAFFLDLTTRKLKDVKDVLPENGASLIWHDSTNEYIPIKNHYTYGLLDVYNPTPGTDPNANNQEGWVLKWSDTRNQFYQFAPELKDNFNVNIPAWNDYYSTSNPGGNRTGDMLIYDGGTGFGTYVNKQNTIGNLTDVPSKPNTGRHVLSTNSFGSISWRNAEEQYIKKQIFCDGSDMPEHNVLDYLNNNATWTGTTWTFDAPKIDVRPFLQEEWGQDTYPDGWYPVSMTFKTFGISHSGDTDELAIWLGGDWNSVVSRANPFLVGDTESSYRRVWTTGTCTTPVFSINGDGTGTSAPWPYIQPIYGVTWHVTQGWPQLPDGYFHFWITSLTVAKRFYVQDQS